jgi:hypothetical protein
VEIELLIGVSAIFVATLALWYAISSSGRKVDADYVRGLERRITALENELQSCQTALSVKLAENVELMRQLVGVPTASD